MQQSQDTGAGGWQPPQGARAQWVAKRLDQMPRLVGFLYNVLLDPSIPWHYKYHVFATLRYLFDDVPGLIPDSDPLLRRIDDLCMVFRCLSELFSTLAPAYMAYYEEVLHRDGVDLRRDVYEAPAYVGNFYWAIAKVYPPHIENLAVLAGNAIKTGELVRKLQAYIASHKGDEWTTERLARVDVFLGRYRYP